jgi:ELWxxDGT repeat protein
MRSAWIGVSLVGLALAAAPAWGREAPYLLADVNRERPASAPVSDVAGFFELGGRLFFSTANPDGNGILWSSDGTGDGTAPLSSSLCPDGCSGITPLATWHGLALLDTAVNDNASLFTSHRLARTDGTPEGTFQLSPLDDPYFEVRQLQAPPESPFAFFIGCDVTGCHIWRSDGTVEGTEILKGTDGLSFDEPEQLVFWQGRLWFVAYHGDSLFGLWSTDGTPQGTVYLHGINEDQNDGARVVATPHHLFFSTGDNGEDLWVTDGTPAGTQRLADFEPVYCHPSCSHQDVNGMLAYGDAVYFLKQGPARTNPIEIWTSDGTESGTGSRISIPAGDFGYGLDRAGSSWMFWVNGPDLTEIPWTVDDAFTRAAPLSGCEGGSCPQRFGQFLDQLPGGGRLLVAGDAAHGDELWITDGTGPGTRRLTDVCPGTCSGAFALYGIQTSYLSPSGEVYFHAFPTGNDNLPDGELWRTDGTSEGTYRIAESFSDLGFFQGRAWFGTSHRFPGGIELWALDGTLSRPRRVKVLHRLPAGSDPQIQRFRKGVLLQVGTEASPYQIWRSDGTPQGTGLIYRFSPDRIIQSFLPTQGPLQLLEVFHFPAAKPSPYHTEIWRTDGASHTQEVADLGPWRDIDLRAPWGGRLLFTTVDTNVGGCPIWVSDGTAVGTREILPPLPGLRCPTAIVPFGSRFLFIARLGAGQSPTPQVFLSDGTPAGTRRISAVQEPRDPFYDDQPVQAGGTVFFRLYNPDRFPELWRTDGTAEGTWRVSPLPGVDDLYAFRGSLYFTADLDPDGRGLFRMSLPNGTPVLLAVVNPTASYSSFGYSPAQLTPVGNRLLFAARDEKGVEPWVTDGTPAGTHRLADLQTGPDGSYPDGFVSAGDRAFFTADDGSHGRELWESDGTPEGTRMLIDLDPGGYSGLPFSYAGLTLSNGYLFFAADDGNTGLEPWALWLEP